MTDHRRLTRDELLRDESRVLVLLRRSGVPGGFVWPGDDHRRPPLPYYDQDQPGRCRVCGQAVYAGGRWRADAGEEPSRGTWHKLCAGVYFVWTRYRDQAEALLDHQGGKCALTGREIYLADAEVDHAEPLYRVAAERAAAAPWVLLRFWGVANLRVVARRAHQAKSAIEAGDRRRLRAGPHHDLFAEAAE